MKNKLIKSIQQSTPKETQTNDLYYLAFAGGAVNKFDYLPQGIAIVLIFIGVKMLGEHYINMVLDKTQQVFVSLGVILVCLAGSIFYSMFVDKKKQKNVGTTILDDDQAH